MTDTTWTKTDDLFYAEASDLSALPTDSRYTLPNGIRFNKSNLRANYDHGGDAELLGWYIVVDGKKVGFVFND